MNQIVADTGATNHFFHLDTSSNNNIPLKNIRPTSEGVQVILPNNQKMQATHEAELDIPDLPPESKTANIFSNLASGSLYAIGPLCDAGCIAIFTKHKLYIIRNNKILLTGTRLGNKLWTMDPLPPQAQSNAAIDIPTLRDRIKFLHASLWRPKTDTWAKEITAAYLPTFPQVTTKQLRLIKPESDATIKGHMNAKQKNLRSTKQEYKAPNFLYSANVEQAKQMTNEFFPQVVSVTGQVYTDQTGQFHVPAASGNKYLFVLYDYDSNYIFAVPIPRRAKECILNAYKTVYKTLASRGLKPRIQRLDNEVSDILKEYMRDKGVSYQLTPAGDHARNLAERAIQTFKNNFISGLSTTHLDFPLNQWDKLVPQAELTLNILRPSRINPHLSAYAQVHGNYDWGKHPFAPPGLRVLAHERPDDRKNMGTSCN